MRTFDKVPVTKASHMAALRVRARQHCMVHGEEHTGARAEGQRARSSYSLARVVSENPPEFKHMHLKASQHTHLKEVPFSIS
jgi:hypothetical protein